MTPSANIGQRRIASAVVAALVCIGVFVLLLVACGFVPRIWLCDIASQLRLVYGIVLLICVAILLLLRSRIGTAICVAAFTLNAFPIVSLLPKVKCTTRENTQTISILNFNSEFQHNDHYALLNNIISERKPDIIALVEINKTWIDAIKPTTQHYPYSKI